jgi:PucR C-terminal helix-turn-helix domain/GGDEF-like domain
VPVTPDRHDESVVILRKATGRLTQAVLTRIENDRQWFRELSAEQRSWVGLIIQAAVRGFVDWYAAGDQRPLTTEPGHALAQDMFGAAPRTMAGVVNLQQTVDLVRLGIDVVEDNLDPLLGKVRARDVHAALLRYGREIAFATAEVYARAAEVRGAWDARLEALVVDSVVRAETDDDSIPSRASALGWTELGEVVVVTGTVPAELTQGDVIEGVRRSVRLAGLEALCAVQDDQLVVILGGVTTDPGRPGGKPGTSVTAAAQIVAEHCAAGPVVVGPVAADLPRAHASAAAAAFGLRAAAAWPGAPRPVAADDLLPERALAGDQTAVSHLVRLVYVPLVEARGTLVETLEAWFDNRSSVEATARALFVHPNTVRYRIRQAGEITGLTATQPRDGYALRVAISLGRLAGGPALTDR